jgi:hypothetical protein
MSTQYIPQMTARIKPVILMANTLFFEFYYAIAQMGLGLGGIVYDLNLPGQCASR